MTKTVIVTGAAGGMGLAALHILAQRDVNVVCVDLDRSTVSQAVDAIGATRGRFLAIGADVGDDSAVRNYVAHGVEEFGALHGVFNIAGIEGDVVPVTQATVENFDRVMAVNARSVFLNMKYATPHLVAAGGGSIVSTGSYLATRGYPLCGCYGASKHAVVGITKSFALEVAPQNVRANVVAPGATDTRMMRATFEAMSGGAAAAEAALVAAIPQQRMADPAEIAATGIWLLLDAPGHITGQVLRVDGGLSAA
ncbi:SDR family NAD(P)-dependent oxidoreductase [Rhizorhabdus dicambivorans]|nr:SDR family oxidoreductase [Rhizorhabdus dicambivorans]